MYIPNPKKAPFDIRDFIPEAEWDNDHIQARYDTVNRMALLIGDVPFADLFTTQWEGLLPALTERLKDAATYGLHRERPELGDKDAISCLARLENSFSEHTFCSYMGAGYCKVNGYHEGLRGASSEFVSLWRQGIYLPFLCGKTCTDGDRQDAVAGLRDHAGKRTFKDVYKLRTTHRDAAEAAAWSAREVQAVRLALRVGILFDACPNERCCDSDVSRCTPGRVGDCCFGCSILDDPCEPPPFVDRINPQ